MDEKVCHKRPYVWADGNGVVARTKCPVCEHDDFVHESSGCLVCMVAELRSELEEVTSLLRRLTAQLLGDTL